LSGLFFLLSAVTLWCKLSKLILGELIMPEIGQETDVMRERFILRRLMLALQLAFALFAAATATIAQDSSTFNVGAILPLSGPLADFGTAVRNGMELAVKDRPAAFKNVRFIYQDSSYDGKKSVSAFNALLARGDIDLYYVWGVTPSETLLPVLHARGLPVVVETTLRSSLNGKPFAVRAAPTGDQTARVLSAELLKRGLRSVGMLLVDIPYYRDIVNSLKGYMAAGGGSIEIVDEFSPDFTDFKTIIAKLKARNSDALGIFLLNDQVVAYYRQSRDLRFSKPTFGAAIHDSQDLVNSAGPGAEGALLVSYDVVPGFRSRWISEFGNDARMGTGANSYDVANIVARLFGDGQSSSLSAADTVSRFASIKNYNGASTNLSFADTPEAGKHFEFPLSARIIRDGAIKCLP
jgi:branched-chain amino acid transport system substrate-binding protein